MTCCIPEYTFGFKGLLKCHMFVVSPSLHPDVSWAHARCVVKKYEQREALFGFDNKVL